MSGREIKFRAWDGERKLMICDFENIEHPVAIEYYITLYNGALKIGATKHNGDFYELEPLRFTGLKDKNGKEIYEGDIVCEGKRNFKAEIKFGTFEIGRDSWDIPIVTTGFVCAFRDGGYTGLNMKSSGAHGFACEEIEVIGNVYENPELK